MLTLICVLGISVVDIFVFVYCDAGVDLDGTASVIGAC